MKRKVAIFIAVAVIASIFVAGCTSSAPNSSSNQSTSQAASASQSSASGNHDKVIQAVIDDDQQAYVNATWTRTVNKSVQWINDTTAMVTFKIGYSNSSTLQYTAKYLKFSDDAQASDYVGSISQGYNSTSAISLVNDIALTTASSVNNHQNYEKATSRLPTTNAYGKVNDQGSAYQGSYIIRVNEVVVTYNVTVPKSASSPGPAQ
ncbi:MAG: hypothetical protein ACXVIG_00855 [Halobacteriota archaeon]